MAIPPSRILIKIELNNIKWVLLFVVQTMMSCATDSSSKEKLEVVTHSQFDEFVKKTGYITDAEQFGWSIVQKDVFNFSKVGGADWKKPDGRNSPESGDLPVTQISYICIFTPQNTTAQCSEISTTKSFSKKP